MVSPLLTQILTYCCQMDIKLMKEEKIRLTKEEIETVIKCTELLDKVTKIIKTKCKERTNKTYFSFLLDEKDEIIDLLKPDSIGKLQNAIDQLQKICLKVTAVTINQEDQNILNETLFFIQLLIVIFESPHNINTQYPFEIYR